MRLHNLRTEARLTASPLGKSGGSGYTSSKYSKMAKDWDKTAPSISKHGTVPLGLVCLYSSPFYKKWIN